MRCNPCGDTVIYREEKGKTALAIYCCQMSVISRSFGRSAVAAIAYRSAETLTNERDGLVHKYENRQGVEHSEILLPEGVNAEWALDRSALWNAAEFAEKRSDARVAREFVIALPHELSPEARQELTREFAQDLANRYGAAVDFAIHAPHPQGDVRNHHAHVMMTTRQVTEEGLGAKTYLELANKELLPKGLPSTQMQLVDIRRSWEGMANERLALEGHDIRIDHRSHSERGLEIEPTEHVGVRATNMQRRGGQVDRARLDEEAAQRNAELIREKPEQVLTVITQEKSVFDQRDIARTLHRYINDDAQTFQNVFASVMASPALAQLQAERIDQQTGEIELAKYSTREMVNLETGMAQSAERMAEARNHGVDRRYVERAMQRQDDAIRRSSGEDTARLSDEQRQAIEHITGPERISAVVGFAGAGKSTMLAAAREAWEAQGYQVHGAALSGKAAEGLEESSGIESRTLASWSRGWERERNQLSRGDVFVIDEAGMVGSRQLAGFIGEAEQRGAKIVLVGDHEQLQAIGAGAPFRAIAEQIGHAELSDIRRQREDWQREASVSFATHRTAEGLAAYREHGDIHLAADGDEARAEIVRDYLADRDARPDGSRVAMAHRRADVRAINAAIRTELQDRGALPRMAEAGDLGAEGPVSREQEQPRAFSYQTDNGQREFAEGDRIVFLQNDPDLGVKNGMLGTVMTVEQDAIQVQLDGKSAEDPRAVTVPMNSYQSVDHGYATTIHKNQGATVDHAFVMVSGTMDRHLTYVAMTRHRDGVQLYVDRQEFTDRKAGKLVEHGVAPYEHREGNRDSYFVTLENGKGERHTTWGVGLAQAMREASPEIGAMIALRHEGSEPVRLPDGTETHRNAWRVQGVDELAYSQLASRLSRSGAKETTLDYTRDFAERRGMAEAFSVKSEIDLSSAEKSVRQTTGPDHVSQKAGAHPGQDFHVDPVADPGVSSPQASPRRSVFDGLKLSRGGSGINPKQERVAMADENTRQNAKKGPEKAETQRGPQRSMFDGLKLKASRDPSLREQKPEKASLRLYPEREEQAQKAPDNQAEMKQAVDQYARAYGSIQRQKQEKLPVLDSQRQALQNAGDKLDRLEAGSSESLSSALKHDPHTARAMTERSGGERTSALIDGMEREKLQQQDPNVRAGRFVKEWQGLSQTRENNGGWMPSEIAARKEAEGKMRDLVQKLDKDPAMEEALRTNHSKELDVRQQQDLSKELGQKIERGPSLGLGM